MSFNVVRAVLPAQSAAGATSVTLMDAIPTSFSEPSFQAGKISVTSPSLVTGAATNYATINVRQLRAGSVVGTIGTLALNASSVTLPAETEVNIPVAANTLLLDGDVLDVQLVQTGTGLALPAGIVAKVEIE